jgi:hypothetical protein
VSYSCVKHPMALAEYLCGQCGHEFCPECVVFPYGVDKPPVCITCALELSGVRKRATGRPKLSRREVRRRLKEQQADRVRAQAVTEAPEEPPEEPTYEDEKWMQGIGDPEDFPGGWTQRY